LNIFKPDGGKMQIQGHFLTPQAGMQNDKGDLQAALTI
jgi:hypothetical protein